MKSVLYLIAVISITALVMLTPAVGWSQMGGSGGMTGGNNTGMMGGSMMNNRGRMSGRDTMQNGTGVIGTIDNLMNNIRHFLGQGIETNHRNSNNATVARSNKHARTQERTNIRNDGGGNRQTMNK
ncbi:MAG: hypothetical protein ACM3MD_11290 [Betaproteobacteria bacterium]